MSALKFSGQAMRELIAGRKTVRLVGDHGVYFLPPDTTRPIVYAVGCDPDKDDFDDWWGLKRSTFGGDDGVEDIPSATIAQVLGKKKKFLTVEFTAEQLFFQ